MKTSRARHAPEEARRLELERALRKLQSGQNPAVVLQALARRLTSKLLHAPTKEIGL